MTCGPSDFLERSQHTEGDFLEIFRTPLKRNLASDELRHIEEIVKQA